MAAIEFKDCLQPPSSEELVFKSKNCRRGERKNPTASQHSRLREFLHPPVAAPAKTHPQIIKEAKPPCTQTPEAAKKVCAVPTGQHYSLLAIRNQTLLQLCSLGKCLQLSTPYL